MLLCMSGALMMIIIGNSLARAFGIAGAASIIRFRTPVDDPKDVTILFLLMGLGMSAGLGAFAVAGLGTAFLDEIDATVSRILQNPTAWHPLSSRTRRCRTHRFPFGLIYQIRPSEILITSVMDLRRDPVSWQDLV